MFDLFAEDVAVAGVTREVEVPERFRTAVSFDFQAA
jgi:hypothetical protein